MIRHTYSIIVAALLMTGAMLTTACSSDEAVIDDKPIVLDKPTPVNNGTVKFTATLAPKGDNGSGTRAITVNNQGTATETLTVGWKAGEKIAVYYEKNGGDYDKATATVTAVTDGKATISATLSDAKNGGTVKFVYPASLVNATGDDIDEDILRSNQLGTITDISTNFDAATGSGTISTSAGTAVVSGTVSLTNRVCICKFSFSYKSTTNETVSVTNFASLKIFTPDGAYVVNTETTDAIYVAMLPCDKADMTFFADAKVSGTSCFFAAFPKKVSLTAGKFYRNLPITLKQGKDLSNGNTPAEDGDIIVQRNNENPTSHIITIAADATVTLAGVNISATGSSGITCAGNANIILVGTNTVITTANGKPAIQAGYHDTETKTLTISGSGSLTATGGSDAAGIGSGYDGTCGNITISGGEVTANGGSQGAGIGSGYSQATCGDITISGGTVIATGGSGAAGIGSGYSADACGNITITENIVNVTATKGSVFPEMGTNYCIGQGANSPDIGTITIGDTMYYNSSTGEWKSDALENELKAAEFTYQP